VARDLARKQRLAAAEIWRACSSSPPSGCIRPDSAERSLDTPHGSCSGIAETLLQSNIFTPEEEKHNSAKNHNNLSMNNSNTLAALFPEGLFVADLTDTPRSSNKPHNVIVPHHHSSSSLDGSELYAQDFPNSLASSGVSSTSTLPKSLINDLYENHLNHPTDSPDISRDVLSSVPLSPSSSFSSSSPLSSGSELFHRLRGKCHVVTAIFTLSAIAPWRLPLAFHSLFSALRPVINTETNQLLCSLNVLSGGFRLLPRLRSL
jgi:hypothetical protein